MLPHYTLSVLMNVVIMMYDRVSNNQKLCSELTIFLELMSKCGPGTKFWRIQGVPAEYIFWDPQKLCYFEWSTCMNSPTSRFKINLELESPLIETVLVRDPLCFISIVMLLI